MLPEKLNTYLQKLLSYPPNVLFTKDNPSGKEKKLEMRCIKLVDSYWKIDSDYHQNIRNLTHDLSNSLFMMCNDTVLEYIFREAGSLQKEVDTYQKLIQNTCKQEQTLKEYYSTLGKVNLFSIMLDEVKSFDESLVDIEKFKIWFKEGL